MDWSDEQLQSVLLHELAHIKRRDTLAQLLAQVACALHWFNPLVWFAAWRLHVHVERERACDDLVLANGVRASAYAEHLLHIATRLSSSPWTQACGLAMARSSSLHGRMAAVLSEKQNRRRVSALVVSASALLGAVISMPIAMLGAADAIQEGKDQTPPTKNSVASAAPANDSQALGSMPKSPEGQALFRYCVDHARLNYDIPGGLISRLHDKVQEFIRNNSGDTFGDPYAKKMQPLVKRFEKAGDWKQADVVSLFDDIAAVSGIPLETTLEQIRERTLQRGSRLPAALEKMNWGEPLPGGLRTAWVLEPGAEKYHLGSSLKSRVLIHNSGTEPGAVMLSGDHNLQVNPEWWLGFIKERLNRDAPLPADPKEREVILFRVVQDLFGTAPRPEEANTFLPDKSPAALDNLALRLSERSWLTSVAGPIQSGITKFRVMPEDPDAATRTRVAMNPGRYDLGEDMRFVVSHRPQGERIVNEASITWYPAGNDSKSHIVSLPDGYDTWAAAWSPGSTMLWVQQKSGFHSYDFSNPAEVKENAVEQDKVLAEIRKALPAKLAVPEAPGAPNPAAAAAAAPAAEANPSGENQDPPNAQTVPSANSELQPKHEYAQRLFRKWQASARTDGKIPGALIGHVAKTLNVFVTQYPDHETTPQLAALRPNFDPSHDWEQADVVALLDDVTAISTAPVSWADTPMESSEMWTIQAGEPLSIELKSAAWGEPAANGLRAAWLLMPRAEQYPLGSVLKARVLFHNSGTKPVVFKTESWHQDDRHTAHDTSGVGIDVGNTFYTGVTPMVTYRLEPGEYAEVSGHGIAIGAAEYVEERSTGSVGAWIEAKEGDDVWFSSSVDASREGWTRPDDPKDPVELWKLVVRQRVEREAPLPLTVADREQLIRRVTLGLFGERPTAEEIAAFQADNAPDALETLVTRLQTKTRIEPFVGKLPTGEIRFRVIAADPNAAKAPRAAKSPGRYVLGDDTTHLLVSQRTEGGKRTNQARIAFLSPDPKVASPHKPHEIILPDGLETYAFAWDRGAGVVWLVTPGVVRSYDFTNPSQVQEARFEPGSMISIPEHLHEALGESRSLLIISPTMP